MLFKHLDEVYKSSNRLYSCSLISDLEFAKLGLLRCLSHAKTGHQFLQHHADHTETYIDPSHFSITLKSKLRLTIMFPLNDLLRETIKAV